MSNENRVDDRARPADRPVRTEIVVPDDLSVEDRQRMHQLMAGHFANIRRDQFERDLSEKDWAVVISDANGRIQGFTTLALLEARDAGRTIFGFYSGDTVLAPEFWGEHGWLGVWSRHVFAEAEKRSPSKCYWVLLTATHRTYRFLPGFFREYYPRHDQPTPHEWQNRLDTFVRLKFPNEYDSQRSVVSLKSPTPVLQPGQAESGVPLDDPHSQFFVRRNPGYLQSDFLACITDIDRSNTTRLGQRVLGTH